MWEDSRIFGGVRSGALLGFDLQPRTFVATATAIGLIVDAARLPFYLWRESGPLVQHARWIGIAIIGVVLGAILGSRLLVRIPERRFRRMVAVVVGLLANRMNPRPVQRVHGCAVFVGP